MQAEGEGIEALPAVFLKTQRSQPLLSSLALFISSSIEGMRKPAELWILERNVYHALKDLLLELDYQFAEKNTNLDVDEFFDRMINILNSSKQKWSQQVTPVNIKKT